MKIKELFLNENDLILSEPTDPQDEREALQQRLDQLKRRRDELERQEKDETPRGMDLDTGSDPIRGFVSPKQKRDIDQHPDSYKFGSPELKDPNFQKPLITTDDPKNLMPRGQRDFGDPPPGMQRPMPIPKRNISI